MPWHVVHTLPNRESFARDELRRRGYPVLYLHYEAVSRHARRETTVIRPRFPRYLFAAVEGDLSVYGINTCPGVSTVLNGPNGPLALSDGVMADLRAIAIDADGLCVAPTPEERVRWKQGDVVRVRKGPFEGFLAVIGVDSGIALKIWMEAFGGRISVEIAPEHVEPASPGLSETSETPRRHPARQRRR